MGFIDRLTKVTGTEKVGGVAGLIDGTIKGEPKFVNSGVGLNRVLLRSTLDFEPSSKGVADFFKQGARFNPTRLNMPQNCLNQGPHYHPGGEFAYVVDGEYFDADMEGRVIRAYSRDSTVFYNVGSSHRPLSRYGAAIVYIPFDGIVFGENPRDLANRMVKLPTTEEALEYALMWMVPDVAERQRIMDDLVSQIKKPE